MGNTDKVVEYIAECIMMQIEVLAPDINECGVDLTPLYKGYGEIASSHKPQALQEHVGIFLLQLSRIT